MAQNNPTISFHIQRRITGIFLVACFIALVAIFLAPFASIVLTSFKDSKLIIRDGFNLNFNTSLTLDNYKNIFMVDQRYFRWFGNSVVLTFAQTILTLLVSAWVGYGFAMYSFKGKNVLFICVLIIMMIPFEILMLPLYKEAIALDLIDNYWGIILPYLANPIAIFFFSQYLKGIPKDIVDSGRIDGCLVWNFHKVISANYEAGACSHGDFCRNDLVEQLPLAITHSKG